MGEAKVAAQLVRRARAIACASGASETAGRAGSALSGIDLTDHLLHGRILDADILYAAACEHGGDHLLHARLRGVDIQHEAMRLARMLSALAPDEVEVLGLQALLELQGSRMNARLDQDGLPVLLEAQDRTRWDQLLIHRGMAALREAERLAASWKAVGKYFLQASIAAQHARANKAEDTDWRRIAYLYDVLSGAAPGPTVEVNRAVAHGRAFGPDAGLAVLERLDADALGDSPLVPSVRGDLLERAGLHAQAGEAFAEAVEGVEEDG